MAIGVMRALRDLGLTIPGDCQRRRLRRHRPRPARGSPTHDGPSADPSKGRRGGPPAADRHPATGLGHPRASPARDATGRPRLDRSGPTCAMTVDTPAWVRDAIFYQIFPDRFASSERVHKPGILEPWDAPPTNHGFKGGDLRGIVEHLDYLDDLGITAIYLTPIFSSASNHRYHTVRLLRGRPAARRRRCTARAARRGARPRDARRPRRRLQPHRPRLLPVPPRDGGRAVLAVPALVPHRRCASRRGPAVARLPATRDAIERARLQGLVGSAGIAQAQHRSPRGPRVPDDGRRVLAPVRDRWLAAGRAR